MRGDNKMKLETWYKKKLKEFRDNVDFLTETAILDFTEKIVEKMQKSGMSRADFAAKLGVSKPFITKLLNGNPNMTIRTMVSIAHALDCELNLAVCPKGFEVKTFAVSKDVDAKKFTEKFKPVIGEVEYASAA
jgi:transcriptional regulator with XRE-family HTH domain